VQRALFREQLQKVKDRRKTVKLSMQVEQGSVPPTKEQVEKYLELQRAHKERMRQRHASLASNRHSTILQTSGACSFAQVPDPGKADALHGAEPQNASSPPAEGQDGPSTEQASMQCSQTPSGPPEDVLRALQCIEASDGLAKRAFSRRRFINAVGTVVVRCAGPPTETV
jgi:hypothetical protein